ncbi:MAG: DUF11 domain-containing protein [Candidatus Thermoplasmatota archaeon]|nr:DUF11 domain-containing protein [Candidatus Thermoplasmatota archaeon]MBS3802323.1 DUF11 domain-containing protein [Candidatus Thermoplasmatota archaeon]
MNKNKKRRINGKISALITVVTLIIIILPSNQLIADSSFSDTLSEAVLSDPSCLVSSSYSDTDEYGNRQAALLSGLGTMNATDGDSFVLLSTGIAGSYPATSDAENPGSERGSWFKGGQYPRNSWFNQIYDRSTLSMDLIVPDDMNYLYYDMQFFSTEYPEYVGTYYNDKFTVTVDSPSKGQSSYVTDVNNGHFVLDSHFLTGTGFDIFSQEGDPDQVDMVDTTPRTPGADAGATALHTEGGHPVSPNEQVTITFEIQDVYDNQFDSTAFIDNIMFAKYARPVLETSKKVEDITGGEVEINDTLEYTITISNTGVIDQPNDANTNELEDFIPENTEYIQDSATTTSGEISYSSSEEKIIWNGDIPADTSIAITFKVKITDQPSNNVISNQADVYWDKNNDGENEELLQTNWANISIYGTSPVSVTETFADDDVGNSANETYNGNEWFTTLKDEGGSCNFEVSDAFEFDTNNSFKTKVRKDSDPLYWYYYPENLGSSDISAWEIWFYCGNVSKESKDSDLILEFQDDATDIIAKISIEYDHISNNLLGWAPKLMVGVGEYQLNSIYSGGYLFNGWYHLRIEQNETEGTDYILSQANQDSTKVTITDQSFAGLNRIYWSSTDDAIICPMFFWDDHIIELSS